jgi:ferredoxin-NADP reductase/MOSC domain-containing protein YiiM
MGSQIHGTVATVCVGRPREVVHRGRTVRTGIFKQPVTGVVTIGPTGLRGDGQADLSVHGGVARAVYAYPGEHYAYWQERLGCELSPSSFGENLTLCGVLEDDLRLGDVLEVGTALLEVREPRTPCYKLGIRLERDDAVAMFLRAARPGVYFSVRRPGEVWAGAAVRIREPRPSTPTVAEAFELYVNPRADRVDHLRAALEVPALADDLAVQYRRHLARLTDPDAPAWVGFRDFEVAAVRPEARDVVSVWLAPCDGAPLPSHRAGQYVAVELPGPVTGGEPLYRCYSLSDRPAPDRWRITVKRQGPGGGSAAVHRLAVSDVVRMSAPQGRFCAPGGDAPLWLLGGGIGITPLLAIAHELAATRRAAPVRLVVGFRDASDVVAARELEQLAAAGIDVRVALSRGGSVRGLRTFTGRLSTPLLASIGPLRGEFLICGPTGMIDELGAALVAAGVDPRSVRCETFGGAAVAADPPAVPPGGLEVTFSESVRTLLWSDAAHTLLDIAEDAEVAIPSACRTGACGTCRLRILAGDVIHRTQPAVPLDDDECLACIATPATRLSVAA